jgi:hypothetical protein
MLRQEDHEFKASWGYIAEILSSRNRINKNRQYK